MTKSEFFARFTKKTSSVKVQDSQTLEWLKPSQVYKVKTMYSADMALFTPIKY